MIAAVLVLVVGLGAGAVVVWSKLSGAEDRVLDIAWQKTSTEERLSSGSEPVETYATWLVDEFVVRASTDGVAAYRLSDGTREWTVALPDGARLCTAAVNSSGGRGVIAFGSRRCDQLGVVDLRAGELASTAQVPTPKNVGKRPPEIRVVAAGDIAVVDDEGAMTAFAITDGEQRWRREDGECSDKVWAMSEKRIVFDRLCALTAQKFVGTLDTATGRELTETDIGRRSVVLNVPSVDPLVAVIGRNQEPDPTVIAIDDSGKEVAAISSRGPGRDLHVLGTTSLTASVTIDLPSLFVRDNMLYAVNKAADPRNVVAFDLTTGEQVWTEKRNVGEAKIIRVDESGVWAMETTSSEGSLVVIDHKSGETSVRKKGVLSMAWSSMRSSFVYEHQGTLVVTTRSRQVPDLLPSLVVLR